MPRMPSVPLMRARPSLARSVTGARPARASASAVGSTPPSAAHTSPSPISASAQWLSGARSPLAPSEPCSRTTGVMPCVQQRELQVDDLRAGARVAHRQAAGPQEQHRPHHLGLDRVAHAGGVRAHQRDLQLGGALGRDDRVGQRAEAGGDAVHRLLAGDEPVDERGAALHRGAGAVAETARRRRARATATTSAIGRPRPSTSTDRECSRQAACLSSYATACHTAQHDRRAHQRPAAGHRPRARAAPRRRRPPRRHRPGRRRPRRRSHAQHRAAAAAVAGVGRLRRTRRRRPLRARAASCCASPARSPATAALPRLAEPVLAALADAHRRVGLPRRAGRRPPCRLRGDGARARTPCATSAGSANVSPAAARPSAPRSPATSTPTAPWCAPTPSRTASPPSPRRCTAPTATWSARISVVGPSFRLTGAALAARPRRGRRARPRRSARWQGHQRAQRLVVRERRTARTRGS